MSNFLHKLRDSFAALTGDPARASKAVFTLFTLVAFTGFVFQSQLDAANLQSKILAMKVKAAAQNELQKSGKTDTIITSCATSRAKDAAKKLIEAVEADFKGVVPGISTLLNADPVDTKNRTDKLVFEVLSRYGQLQFCMQRENFTENPIFSEQSDLQIALQDLFQVEMMESKKAKTIPPEKYAIPNDVINETIKRVGKEMSATELKVRGIILTAIAAANKIDDATEAQASNNMQRSATLGDADKDELQNQVKNAGDRGNKIVEQDRDLNQNIEKILLSFRNGTPTYTTPLSLKPAKSLTPKESALTSVTKKDKPEEIQKKIEKNFDKKQFSTGLLNLIDPELLKARIDFLKLAAAKYIAAASGVDVANQPKLPKIEDLDLTPKCPAVDDPNGRGACFIEETNQVKPTGGDIGLLKQDQYTGIDQQILQASPEMQAAISSANQKIDGLMAQYPECQQASTCKNENAIRQYNAIVTDINTTQKQILSKK